MAEKKPAGADDVMSVAEMKQLLAKTRRGDPVSCAMALSTERDAVLLLDRKKKPRQLSMELRKRAKEAGLELTLPTIRFGHAEIDGEEDARTVRFLVNKDAPGTFVPKFTALVRKAGFGHVEIVTDAELEAEHKASDEEHRDAGGPHQAGGAPDAALAAVAKSGQVWEATLKSVERQVAGLHEKLAAAYDGHGFAAELDRAFHAKVEPMLESLDASLMRKLAEVAGTEDAAARARAIGEAQQLIGACEAYLQGETLIRKLDANPLHPLAIAKTLTASLEAVRRVLNGAAAR